MTKNETKTGKELERRVADAYREMRARKAEHDVELAGNQIDVYVELETPGRLLHRIAVEAKDRARPVGVKIVNDFIQIVDLLRRAHLIDEGIIVSATGFTRPARKAAETHGIRLLEEADLDAMVSGAREKEGLSLKRGQVADILEKYEGQRIKADRPEEVDQFFVHREKLHYIDLGAASICETRGLPVKNLMPNEEFILDIPGLRGSDYNELAMKAVFEEIDQTRVVGDSATDTREPVAPARRDENQQHLRDLIAIKRRRLWELEKQAALYGIDVPPHTTLEIEDLRREIAELKAQVER